jgi:hypothetical protein
MAWYAMFNKAPTPEEKPGIGELKVARSADGGRSLENPIVVSKGFCYYPGAPAPPADFIPAIAADTTNGPFRNHVYIAWDDARSGRQEIWFTASEDGGKTWQPGRVISSDHAVDPEKPWNGPHDINPAVVVNKDGVIGVFYYAQRTPKSGYWPKFTVSSDGGTTWSEAATIPGVSYNRENPPMIWTARRYEYGEPKKEVTPLQVGFGPAFGPHDRAGDTSGIVADSNGVFHLFAQDDHSGVSQIYTVTAQVSGRLSRLKEVGRGIQVDLSSDGYDPQQSTASTSVTIKNTSDHDLQMPMRLVAIDVPATGTNRVDILNADNKREGAGAYWIIGSDVPGNVLRPGQKTPPRSLKFRFTEKVTDPLGKPSMSVTLRTYVVEP